MNLLPVIQWLENGCDPKEAAKELRIYHTQQYDAVAAEREACARACEDLHHKWRFGDGEDSTSGPKECSAAIRAR